MRFRQAGGFWFGIGLGAIQWVAPMIWPDIDPVILKLIFWVAVVIVAFSTVMIVWEWIMGDDDKTEKNGGFSLNIGTMSGGQAAQTIHNYEDRSSTRQLRDLFNTIDPRINRLQGRIAVRMEPYHLERLKEIISAGDSAVQILGANVPMEGVTLDNGSLGITYSAEYQQVVWLSIAEPIG